MPAPGDAESSLRNMRAGRSALLSARLISAAHVGAVAAGLAAGLAACRLLVGALFARHACRTVFGRSPPQSASALARLLTVTRPLELAWRLLTARFRCTPDVYILGEVRCGTTTAASLLRSELGMHGPFTPWVHPLAEQKESFYFVGHMCGLVSPALYAMAFPLRATRWLHARFRGHRLWLFDGCASYLSAPWAPRLVRRSGRGKEGGSVMGSEGGACCGAASNAGGGEEWLGHSGVSCGCRLRRDGGKEQPRREWHGRSAGAVAWFGVSGWTHARGRVGHWPPGQVGVVWA